VQQLPLVSIELQRVTAGFRDAARELGAARQVVADAGTGALGTPACDAAVEAGLRDLADVLERLEATATACVPAVGRYGDAESSETQGHET
jgi:hypothetical protein